MGPPATVAASHSAEVGHLHAYGESEVARKQDGDPTQVGAARVKAVIAAAKAIRSQASIYGAAVTLAGGTSGYDCSGSVSFALHGGRLLRAR